MQFVNSIVKDVERYIKPQGIKILSLIGLYYVTNRAFSAINYFVKTFCYLRHNLPQRYGPGSWALVTGAARGIGAAFAHELAAQGFNLVLIDFNEDLLKETEASVKTRFPEIKTKTFLYNFSNAWNPGFFDSILKDVEGLDISILVNNVGRGVPPGPFKNAPENLIVDCIAINTLPMAILTHRFMQKMTQREKRSAIINLSSTTSTFPVPMLATYCSTKAFVDSLSRATEREARGKIDIMAVRPCEVSTDMIKNPPIKGFVISPTALAQSVLGKLGRFTETNGHWRHELKDLLKKSHLLRELAVLSFLKQYNK